MFVKRLVTTPTRTAKPDKPRVHVPLEAADHFAF